MGDTDNKSKGKKDFEEANHLHHADPNARTDDESRTAKDEDLPSQNMLRVEKNASIANMTFLPNQFMSVQGHSQPLSSSKDIKDIIESMLRFKWTIVLITILVSVPLLAAIWTQIVPKYRARAELQIRPIIPHLVYKTEDNGMIPLYNSYVNTQVSIIRRPDVLQNALDKKEVQETQWFKKPSKSIMQKLRGTTMSQMERLRNELSVQPRRNTEIVDVSLIAEKGEDAKKVVNAVLEEYIKYIELTSGASKDKLYEQLTYQYDSLKKEISYKEADIARLQKSLETASPQELISAKKIDLEEKRKQHSELLQRIEVLEWNINQDANSGDIYLSDQQLRYSRDTEWRQLDINVRNIKHQIEKSIYTDKHPNMIILKSDLGFAEELLQRREAQLDEQWSNLSGDNKAVPVLATSDNDTSQTEMPKTLKQQLALVKHEEELLRTDLDKQQKEFDALFSDAQRFEEENNELSHTRELYNDVQQRLDQKDIERNVPGSISVSMNAFASSQPYNDRRKVYSAMVIFLGLGLGGGAAFLRVTKNQTVYSPKDIAITEAVPLLGYVPLVNLKKPIGKSLCSEISQNQYLLNESLRVVRTVLLSRLNGKSCTTLLVSSATTGTGKSTFVMLLGRSLAKTGKKVLVVDADFKKMTLSHLYEHTTNDIGFYQALRDPLRYEQDIVSENNLDFMPAGMSKKEPTVPEEIANGAFKTLMGKLSGQYNIILLDGSPILPLADSIILSSQVDGTIFVERENISNRANIITAVERINSSRGKMLGSVFVGSKNHAKYGYDYNYKTT